MPLKLLWLIGFLALFALFCLYQGIRCARRARFAGDFERPINGLGAGTFVPALTAASFAGWLMTSQPGDIYEHGFASGYLSLFVIAVPLTGAVFFNRLFALSQNFNFATPGQMLAQYFRSEPIRMLVALVAVLFALPFLVMTLKATGIALNILSDEVVPVNIGICLAAGLMAIYVILGGFRAVANIGVLQLILLFVSVIATAMIALNFLGGWSAFGDGLAALAQVGESKSHQGYNQYMALPGLYSVEPNRLGALSTMASLVAFTGLLASPAFCLWAFTSKTPNALAPQQVWASAFGLGIVVIVFMTIIGISGHFLGADLALADNFPDSVYNVLAAGLGAGDLSEHPAGFDGLMALLINLMGQTGAQWDAALSGFLAASLIVVMQAAAGAVLLTTSIILSSDGLLGETGKWRTRFAALLLLAASLIVAIFMQESQLSGFGEVPLGVGLQMWPALLAVCFVPWFTKQGVVAGLIVGLLITIFASEAGQNAFSVFSPLWNIHCGFLGLAANFLITLSVSAVSQKKDIHAQHMQFHTFLRDKSPTNQPGMFIWLVPLIWLGCAAGPGALLGNFLFGDPSRAETWMFSLPSIWIWQVLWWIIGIFMIWFIAHRFGVKD